MKCHRVARALLEWHSQCLGRDPGREAGYRSGRSDTIVHGYFQLLSGHFVFLYTDLGK